ncbi:hypothetical protein ACUH96_08780 [Dermabacteraceae bacterium P13077]
MTQEKTDAALAEEFEATSYPFAALLLVGSSIVETNNSTLKQLALISIALVTTLSIYHYLIICTKIRVKRPTLRGTLDHFLPILTILTLAAIAASKLAPHEHVSSTASWFLLLLLMPILLILLFIPLVLVALAEYVYPSTGIKKIPFFGDQCTVPEQLFFLTILTLSLLFTHLALTWPTDNKSKIQILKAHLITIAMTSLSVFSLSDIKVPDAGELPPAIAPVTYLPVANTLACCLALLILYFRPKSGRADDAPRKIQDDTTQSNQKGGHPQQEPTDTETTEHQISTHNSKSANKTLQGINEIGFTILCILLLLRSLRHPK